MIEFHKTEKKPMSKKNQKVKKGLEFLFFPPSIRLSTKRKFFRSLIILTFIFSYYLKYYLKFIDYCFFQNPVIQFLSNFQRESFLIHGSQSAFTVINLHVVEFKLKNQRGSKRK